MKTTTAQTCFEISFEVCNKVGGIHTVVSSKAELLKQAYTQYFLIGPYTQSSEFIEQEIPDTLSQIHQQLKNQGIILHFGKWMIRGQPQVILLEFWGVQQQKNRLKAYLWERFKVDTLLCGYD